MKYLILGDGELAKELRKQTGWSYISRKSDGIEITDEYSYYDKFTSYNTIINCIGYTKTYEKERKLNWNVNYCGVMKLVDVCNEFNKKLVHFSTDYVYANARNEHTEEDIPVHFESWYAYTKLLGEAYVQARANNYLLIRTNFKPRPFPWKKAWDDIKGNFDYIDVITGLIVKLIEKDAKGVYNVGTKPKTYYDLAYETRPYAERDYSDAFNHPKNVVMDLTKMQDKFKDVNNSSK